MRQLNERSKLYIISTLGYVFGCRANVLPQPFPMHNHWLAVLQNKDQLALIVRDGKTFKSALGQPAGVLSS